MANFPPVRAGGRCFQPDIAELRDPGTQRERSKPAQAVPVGITQWDLGKLHISPGCLMKGRVKALKPHLWHFLAETQRLMQGIDHICPERCGNTVFW